MKEVRVVRDRVRVRSHIDGAWNEVEARCTANTHEPSHHSSIRCERFMGHAGLHRYKHQGSIIEFPDSDAWFPHYSVENLR